MIPLLRKEKIKKKLLENKSVSVIELSEFFEVSHETIRRDLKLLDEEGVAIRTHGGAVLADSVVSRVTSEELKHIFVDEKKIIADFVKKHVKSRDCIFVDSSTTAYYVIEALQDIPLKIVTNSIETMSYISKNDMHELIGIGGVISKNGRCFVGTQAQKMLSNYYFDYAFISCRTLELENGAMDSSDEEAEIKRLALKHSKNIWLLADHTKFDKISFAKILDLNEIDYLVTDKKLSKKWSKYFEKNNIKYYDNTKKENDFKE